MGFIDEIKARAKVCKKTIVLPETEGFISARDFPITGKESNIVSFICQLKVSSIKHQSSHALRFS